MSKRVARAYEAVRRRYGKALREMATESDKDRADRLAHDYAVLLERWREVQAENRRLRGET
jgi:hypothetical protein